MVWLQPAAWFGLVALAAPVLIHLLVHARADTLPFPSLRFVRATRLASIRRRLIDDVPLLVVRAGILALATAAVAGPVVLTAGRRALWNARLARAAIVESDAPRNRAEQEVAAAFRGTVIVAPTVAEGMRRAVAWLNDAPPARREIVAFSSFPISALNGGDVAAVPREIGLRFERVGVPPASATLSAQPSLGSSPIAGRAELHARSIVLSGERTSVADHGPAAAAALPIEIDAPEEARGVVDAGLSAVLAERVLAPAEGRRARVVLIGSAAYPAAVAGAAPIRQPWMADAVAAIAHDAPLAAVARTIDAGLTDGRFTHAPWQRLAQGGQPIAAAAADGERLLIVSAAPADSLVSPLLLRAILNGLAPLDRAPRPEVVAIDDARLRAWARPPAPLSSPDPGRSDEDDRRWLWATTLLLLAVEMWMRRTRATQIDAGEGHIADVA